MIELQSPSEASDGRCGHLPYTLIVPDFLIAWNGDGSAFSFRFFSENIIPTPRTQTLFFLWLLNDQNISRVLLIVFEPQQVVSSRNRLSKPEEVKIITCMVRSRLIE